MFAWFACHLVLLRMDLSIRRETSATFSQAVSVSDILHMADCSQENTFRKFYYRPVFNSIPGRIVLSTGSCGLGQE